MRTITWTSLGGKTKTLRLDGTRKQPPTEHGSLLSTVDTLLENFDQRMRIRFNAGFERIMEARTTGMDRAAVLRECHIERRQ